MNLNSRRGGGGGGLRKNPSMEEVWIIYGTCILDVTVIYIMPSVFSVLTCWNKEIECVGCNVPDEFNNLRKSKWNQEQAVISCLPWNMIAVQCTVRVTTLINHKCHVFINISTNITYFYLFYLFRMLHLMMMYFWIKSNLKIQIFSKVTKLYTVPWIRLLS